MSAPSDTWPSLIAELKDQALADIETTITITNEEEFRSHFENLCQQHPDLNGQQLLAKFQRQHVAIIAFTGIVDGAQNLTPPHTLSDLFWQISFCTIEAALTSEITIQDLFQALSPLNKGFKRFGPELPQFPTEPDVQLPLQNSFQEYIECYGIMLSQFASHPAGLTFEPFHSRVDTARESFESSFRDWKEEIRLRESTQPIFPNGPAPPLHYQGTSARFQWLETLGNGTHAQVSRVREVATKSVYAQKTISVPDNSSAREIIEAQVRNEVDIMHKLRHHHIASVLFYTKDEKAFYIIMLPVADYDLRHFLEENCVQAGFPRAEIRRLDEWFGCLVSALAYAHQEQVKHEDIKPSNILIRKNQPYLADFGNAIDFSLMEGSTSTEEYITGTPVYWPPEPKKQRGRKADVFALGCVFSEMLTVRQQRSLSDFRDARYRPHVDNGYAFKSNLPAVYDWLQGLEESGGASDISGLLIVQTINMMADDPGQRPEARAVKRELRHELDALFCLTCG